MKTEKTRSFISYICFVLFILIIFYITLFSRSSSFVYRYEPTLFWSYRDWFLGDMSKGRQILENIALFIPFGFMLYPLLSGIENKRIRLVFTVIAALLFSSFIELTQLCFRVGMAEFDDVFNNTLGAFIGAFLASKIKSTPPIVYPLLVLCGIAVCCSISKASYEIERSFAFQLESADVLNGTLVLKGFCFPYEQDSHNPLDKDLQIILRSTSGGRKLKTNTESQIKREDVNSYFLCDYNYLYSGFRATVPCTEINPKEEYEILVRFDLTDLISTDTYITGTDIHYYPESEFTAPQPNTEGFFADIVNKGILRVYRPDYHCWVYQYQGNLYWIADEDFNFEKNGRTYIQYHLYTTQIDNLPAHRLEHHWYWDNIGDYFEEHEITDELNCVPYRVSVRSIPTEYSIICITTGYYKDGRWIWQSSFRPLIAVQ